MELVCDFNTCDKYYYVNVIDDNLINNIIDGHIAHILQLTLEEYRDILNKYNGCKRNEHRTIFWTQSACLKVIEELEPYLIMANLT